MNARPAYQFRYLKRFLSDDPRLYVYALEFATGEIKVGVTVDPYTRLGQLTSSARRRWDGEATRFLAEPMPTAAAQSVERAVLNTLRAEATECRHIDSEWFVGTTLARVAELIECAETDVAA